MRVIATAGHVDHGKSALVRALTGMEPDRRIEERRRGMSINLGFVWTALPAVGDVAFVDVPGHERLVATMLAGVGPVPAVLFVVAADQGWQPQSEEHLTILDALQVRHAVLAVTRSDLADPEPVRETALARIAESSLGRPEAVAVSSLTGAGLDELRAALVRLVARLPEADPDGGVRLWVDRAFTMHGHGTVATGTLSAGTIALGDRLVVATGTSGELPAGRATVRVRRLETLRTPRSEAAAIARVAVNVHGIAAAGLRRGSALLTPGNWMASEAVDVRLRGDAARELPSRLTLHVGSAAVPVAVRPLGADTARLSLAAPLPLRVNDIGVLRDPGRHRITGAVTVLDVRPPRFTRRGAAARRAGQLDAYRVPDATGVLRRQGLVRRGDLAAMGLECDAEPVAGDWLCDPVRWEHLQRMLRDVVERHAAERPTEPGLTVEAARRALDLPDRTLVNALVQASNGLLDHRDGCLYGSVTRPVLPPAVRAAVEQVRARLAAAPFRAPEAGELEALGLTPKLLAAATAAGELLRLPDGVVLLPDADRRAAAILARLDQPFTTSAARLALDSTRRVVIPLLEHLDRKGWTVRIDEKLRRWAGPAPTDSGPAAARPPGGDGRESNPPVRDPRTPRF